MLKYNQDTFCQKVRDIHGNKYDLSEFVFITTKIKGKVKCNCCGNEFLMTPSDLFRRHGCPKCKVELMKQRYTKSQDTFIEDIKKIHGEKYDFSKVEYKGNKVKVTLTCPIHGDFEILPINLLKGQGCGKCSGTRKFTTEEFIHKAQKVHGDKYDYSQVEYKNREELVTIICPIHGEFKQAPHKHVIGQGCPKCRRSHLETFVESYLVSENITYRDQYTDEWLGRQSLDFYLPEYHIAIECQGIQHLKPVEFYGGDEQYIYVSDLDINKYDKCIHHNVKVIYFIDECNEQYLPSFYQDKCVITNICNLKDFLL